MPSLVTAASRRAGALARDHQPVGPDELDAPRESLVSSVCTWAESELVQSWSSLHAPMKRASTALSTNGTTSRLPAAQILECADRGGRGGNTDAAATAATAMHDSDGRWVKTGGPQRRTVRVGITPAPSLTIGARVVPSPRAQWGPPLRPSLPGGTLETFSIHPWAGVLLVAQPTEVLFDGAQSEFVDFDASRYVPRSTIAPKFSGPKETSTAPGRQGSWAQAVGKSWIHLARIARSDSLGTRAIGSSSAGVLTSPRGRVHVHPAHSRHG